MRIHDLTRACVDPLSTVRTLGASSPAGGPTVLWVARTRPSARIILHAPAVVRPDSGLVWRRHVMSAVLEPTASTMKITKVKEHIGAIVTGLDLSQPADAETRKKLYDAVIENVVLV